MNLLSLWKSSRTLIDQQPPSPPYFLAGEDFFIPAGPREIFVKHIFSASTCMPKFGPVIMSPGICTNANIFRMDDAGCCLSLEHTRSFANMLAAEGFDVYLYHPGYADRTINRYVSRHCPQSRYYGRRYRVAPEFTYRDMVDGEVPAVIDFVCRKTQARTLSWIGYSLGGMLAYSYMAKNPANPIQNCITIGSPMALNQIFFKFIPFINFTSRVLGIEEDTILGNLSHNLVPLTRAIRALPDWFVRFNLVTPYLCNPMNITNAVIRAMLGQIVEPMPRGLQKFFSRLVLKGYSARDNFTRYLTRLRRVRKTRKQFLFFYATGDLIATPESVFLAREVISPYDPENLVGVPSTGHVDLMVGKNAREQVWRPCVQWLLEKQGR